MYFFNLIFVVVISVVNKTTKILRLTMSCKMPSLPAQITHILSTQVHIANKKHRARTLMQTNSNKQIYITA